MSTRQVVPDGSEENAGAVAEEPKRNPRTSFQLILPEEIVQLVKRKAEAHDVAPSVYAQFLLLKGLFGG